MRSRPAATLALTVLAVLTSPARARATVTIRLEVLPPHPSAGQPFHVVYGIQVENDRPVDGAPLEMGRLQVLANPGGPRMPRYMMFGGGPGVAMTMATSVEYIVVAPSAGRYTISGARAVDSASGRVVATHPPVVLQVTASPQGAPSVGNVFPSTPPGFPTPLVPPGFPDPFGLAPQPRPQPQPQPSQGGPGQGGPVATPADPDIPPTGELTGADYNPNGFIRYGVDNPHPYVGQQVVLRAWMYIPAYDAGCEAVTEPGLDGFWSEPLIVNQTTCAPRWVPQSISGRTMTAGLIRKIAVFPTHAGALRVGAMAMNAEYMQGDAFFGSRQQVQAHSPDLVVDVREPPTAGRPADYLPGTVGPVGLQATVDRATVAVGETVTVTVTATGNGYLGSAGIPAPSPVDGLRIHPGSSEVTHGALGNVVQATLQNQYQVVAVRPGAISMGDLAVAWFDPDSGRYNHSTVRLPTITATGAALAPDEDESRSDPATELAPYSPDPSLRPHRAVFVTGARAWGTLALPPVALALALALSALRRRVGTRRLQDAESARTDPDALLAAADRALAAHAPTEAMDLAGRALERARRQHPVEGLDERGRELVAEAQSRCDTARFSGTPGDAEDLVARVRAAVDALAGTA